MESVQSYRLRAIEKLNVADHLVSTTYPMVKEPKLLVSVIENLYGSLDLAMDALLAYEKNFKAIPQYDAVSKVEVFRRKIATKYSICHETISLMDALKKTIDGHKGSSVEFRKDETLVMSDNDYNLTTLKIDDVKKTLQKAKQHLEELFKIIRFEDLR